MPHLAVAKRVRPSIARGYSAAIGSRGLRAAALERGSGFTPRGRVGFDRDELLKPTAVRIHDEDMWVAAGSVSPIEADLLPVGRNGRLAVPGALCQRTRVASVQR